MTVHVTETHPDRPLIGTVWLVHDSPAVRVYRVWFTADEREVGYLNGGHTLTFYDPAETEEGWRTGPATITFAEKGSGWSCYFDIVHDVGAVVTVVRDDAVTKATVIHATPRTA